MTNKTLKDESRKTMLFDMKSKPMASPEIERRREELKASIVKLLRWEIYVDAAYSIGVACTLLILFSWTLARGLITYFPKVYIYLGALAIVLLFGYVLARRAVIPLYDMIDDLASLEVVR